MESNVTMLKVRPTALVSLILSVLALLGVALIWVVSTTSFTPGNAVMATASLTAALSFFVSIALGLSSIRGNKRALAIGALAIDATTLVVFIVLINMMGG